MREADAAVDALHAHCVLLILVEAGEDVEQLCLGHLWDQLNHIVKHDGCLLAYLRRLILGDLVVHIHNLLLVGRREGCVYAGEHLNGSELGRETLTVHQSLNHAHDDVLEVTDADGSEDLLHACYRLWKNKQSSRWLADVIHRFFFKLALSQSKRH